MIDALIRPLMDPPLTKIGTLLTRYKISANMVTYVGFAFGLAAMAAILSHNFVLAGFLFLTNRLCDGLDGGVARASRLTDLGGYLDIISDFIIYPGIPLAISIALPEYALYGVFVIFAMSGAMTSFLAFAIICAKKNIETTVRGQKSFYYLGGICEGFETALFLSAMCFWPLAFPILSVIYGVLCMATTIGRIAQAKHNFTAP